MTERRRVRLLVPDDDAARLAVDAAGRVPVLDLQFEVDDRMTTAAALDASVRGLGVHASIVDYVIDQTTDDEYEGPIEAIAELALGDLPTGWRWERREAALVDTVPALQSYVDARMAEWAGGPVPPRRSPWARRGWQAEFREWIDARLVEHTGVAAVDVTPFRMWGISAVFRVDTPTGVRWAKAVFPGFASEPAITSALDRLVPGSVAHVLDIDATRGWLLLDHVAGTPVSLDLDRTDDAIRALVRLQRTAATRADALRSTGVIDRSIRRLADDLAEALGVEDDRRRSAVRAAVDEVEALGLGSTLVHGDFHPANVMVDGDRVVIFDWSDACWSHPLVDVGAWAAWYRDDPATTDRLWAVWGEAWGVADADLGRARAALDVVVAAHHVVSYVHIARHLEALRVDEALGAVQRFRVDLEAAISRR